MSTESGAAGRIARLPGAPPGRLVEVKRKLDGTEQRFDLEPWLVTDELVVGRWLAGPDNGFGLAAGSYSWGVWRPRLPIGVYRLHAPDGALLLHRFDVIEDVEVGDGEVRYRDLLLDARLLPAPAPGDDRLRFEDEDEVAAAVTAGRLNHAQRWRIEWVRGVLEARPSEVRAWADRAIAEAVAGVGA
jgi:hypothetical protein